MNRIQLLAFALILPPATLARAEAAPTYFRVGDAQIRTGRLRPGTHRYLRYEVKEGRRTARDIWTRTISYETHEGTRQLHIVQRWDEVAPPPGTVLALIQDSWFDPRDFRPLTHLRRAIKSDGEVLSGFRFGIGAVIGISDLVGNTKKDFRLAYDEVPYNFEYDMELIQALPLRTGLVASIPFYDPGIDKKADRYIFKVTGTATIKGWDGTPRACWLISADYNTGSVKSRFWFDKRTQVLVREESAMPDGATFVKTLLPPESADAD
jgi:hypothetical protein